MPGRIVGGVGKPPDFSSPELRRALREKTPEELLELLHTYERQERDLALDIQSLDLIVGGHVHAEHAALDARVRSYARAHRVAYAVALDAVRGRPAPTSPAPQPARPHDELEREGVDARIRKVAEREGIPYGEALERVVDGDPGLRSTSGWRRESS
jgi:hypothetical protein